MIYLGIDTSHTYLAAGLFTEEKVLASVQKECWKHQSEEIFPAIFTLLEETGMKADDIEAVVITKGPGSYTGVRIAMTVAKVLASSKHLPLYTIGTLDLYAGNETCTVVLDARSKRVYFGRYENGIRTAEITVRAAAEVEQEISPDEKVIGDGSHVGRETIFPDIINNFAVTQKRWQKVEQIHLLEPEYLKTKEAYLVRRD